MQFDLKQFNWMLKTGCEKRVKLNLMSFRFFGVYKFFVHCDSLKNYLRVIQED